MISSPEPPLSGCIAPSLSGPIKIGKGSFLALPPVKILSTSSSPNCCGPATIIKSPDGLVTAAWLSQKIEDFRQADDVFELAFAKHIFIVGAKTQKVDQQVAALLSSWDSALSFAAALEDQVEGPCYAAGGKCHPVWKLYPDTQDAFFIATIPSTADEYQSLTVVDGHDRMVAVPSRLYTPPSSVKPLNGLRISIKDNVDLKGVKTSLSSRAWGELYEEATVTAPAVQILIDQGAVVVGKSKLTQFAETEYPTADWVDYHCPFNPRGDGYLTPEGSSAGAAAALAAYAWLDMSIGTDTGGSIREPAAKQGLFGIRPTFGAQSMEGIFPLAHAFDTVGFMARDSALVQEISRVWYPNTLRSSSIKPIKLICLSDYDYKNPEIQSVFDRFVSHVESYLGITRTTLGLEDLWKQKDPTGTGQSIREYIAQGGVMGNVKGFDLWKNTQDFRDDYYKRFQKTPYVNPSIQMKWKAGSEVTKEARDEGLLRKSQFKSWFLDEFLSSPDVIMVLPLSDYEPEYRDDYSSGPWTGSGGFHRNFLSVLSGCPEVIVPIGQSPYTSRVSQRTEYLPSVASFLGAPGSDQVLSQLMHDILLAEKLPTTVKTGSTCF